MRVAVVVIAVGRDPFLALHKIYGYGSIAAATITDPIFNAIGSGNGIEMRDLLANLVENLIHLIKEFEIAHRCLQKGKE